MMEFNDFTALDENELDILSESAARNCEVAAESIEFLDNVDYSDIDVDNLFHGEDFTFLDVSEVEQVLASSSSSSPTMEEATIDSSILQSSMDSMNNVMSIPFPSTQSTNGENANELILLPIPENLQNDPMINSLDSIHLEQAVIEQINVAANGFHGVKLPIVENVRTNMNLIRRPPVQMVQQVIKFPVKKKQKINNTDMNIDKKCSKRKQVFNFPREDGVLFISDSEESPIEAMTLWSNDTDVIIEEMSQEPPEQEIMPSAVITVVKPSAKLHPVEQSSPISETPKTSKVEMTPVIIKGENCPTCNNFYKRLSLHRCKAGVTKKPANSSSTKVSKALRKIKIRKPPKVYACNVCFKKFNIKSNLDLHITISHSALICERCNFVAKTKRLFQIHKMSCESSQSPMIKALTEPIKMEVDDNDENKKAIRITRSKDVK